jgi:pimeloyl-ACP methyl ester carboxylesterase
MSSALHVVRAGAGPRVLFIHGGAADRTTWSIQLATLRERFSMIAYDRRGGDVSVEEHAADAAELLSWRRSPDEVEVRSTLDGAVPGATRQDLCAEQVGREPGRTLVVGSSFGAVIALELIRTRPALAAGAVLIEPPLAAAEDQLALPAAFLAEYDRRVAELGGPAAAEMFLRLVLGDATYDAIPEVFQERSKSKWAEIRADTAALIAYRPRYGELRDVTTPTLLLGGERSLLFFRATLEALRAALPAARMEIVPGAGHMLHAEAHRRFAELVIAFAAEIGHAAA